MENYIGLDAHSKTCTFVILGKNGDEILRKGQINTTERNLKEMVRAVTGKKSLVLEETNIAQWIYCLLKDEVDKLVVCHAAHLPKKSGPKNDFRDAHHLALQLRASNLTAVHHEDSPLMNLRTAISHYEDITIQIAALKNQYKALLRSDGLPTQSSWRTAKNATKWTELNNPTKKIVAERLYEQMQAIEVQKKKYVEDFKSDFYQIPIVRKLCSIPGIGAVRAHAIAAYICTGHRFENKHKLWAYSMLVRHHDESDGYVLRKRIPHGRLELKNAFMGAATRIILSPSQTALKRYYTYLLEEKGLDRTEAKKALARKVAAICLVIMKKDTKYDDKLVIETLKI